MQAIAENATGTKLIELGKVGVNEHLLPVDEPSTAIGGADAPGMATLTVNKSMVPEDGKVSLCSPILPTPY